MFSITLNASTHAHSHGHACAVEQDLQHLDVSGSSVHTLTVRTPALQTLTARACPRLEAVRFAIPPRHCDLHNCRQLRSLRVEQVLGEEGGVAAEVDLQGCHSFPSMALSAVHVWAPKVRAPG